MSKKFRGFLKTLLCLVLSLGVSITPYVPTAQVLAASSYTIKMPDEVDWPSTSLYNGDIYKAISKNIYPKLKSLAAGKIPGDKITWSFKKSPLYFEAKDMNTAIEKFHDWARWYMDSKDSLVSLAGEQIPIGLFDISDSLFYEVKTKKVKNTKGKTVYRCALTSLSVLAWRSPYGVECSRKEALEYYNKCQKQIKMVVEKVIAARQPNGEPLVIEQKLKYIHDWLIIGAIYDGEGLEASKKTGSKGKYGNYKHLWNEYGPIVEGKAVCEGFSYAFKAIVDELVRQTGINVKCEYVRSTTHAWNRVKLNNNWYHVDVTWDIGIGSTIGSRFFLLSDYHLKDVHPGSSGYFGGTSATEKATDTSYDNAKWPHYKKDLSEYTVVFKNPNEVYTSDEATIPSLTVVHGSRELWPDNYQIERVDTPEAGTPAKVGTAKIRIVPTEKGSIKLDGSLTVTVPAKISGSAKSTKNYKLGKAKSIRPFDKTFKPFAATYKYTKQPELAKVLKKSLTLKKGTDYTVSYKNNKKKGWATATITLKGNYTGIITVKYKIVK